MYHTWSNLPPRHNKIPILLTFSFSPFLFRHLFHLALASVSLFIRPFHRSVCPPLFLLVPLYSVLHFTHSARFSISIPIFPVLFLILSLFLSLFTFFPGYSSISLSTSTRNGKVANVGHISWVSWVACQTPLWDFLFPRARAHDMACRKPFCSVILSGTISPMRFDDRGPSSA